MYAPRNWDGASVDPSVRRRLKRLDPRLRVTFSPYSLDPLTGNPIEMEGFDTDLGVPLRGPCADPSFYLWRKTDTQGWVLVQVYALAAGGFGHLQVLKLEADLARWHSPEQAWRIVAGKTERMRAAAAQSKKDYLRDKALDNKKLILDAASGDDGFFRRGGKGFSYAGQTSRTSGGEKVVSRDDRELGL